MEFVMCPIGVIHSPFTAERRTPLQTAHSQAVGQVEVQPEFVEGLRDIEGFSHIILLYVFHCASGYALRVQSPLDRKMHGLFATRHPYRPNAIGLSVVQLLHRHANILEVAGIDVLDGTPLLDIKPYVPEFDAHLDEVRTGWYAGQTVQS
jgi:tRNA-Thr(GGU) m(6)t(6)A37 methyltransferase TsaA